MTGYLLREYVAAASSRREETLALTPTRYRLERGAPAPRDSDAPVTRRAGALRSDGGSAHRDWGLCGLSCRITSWVSIPKTRLEETLARTPALYRPERGAPAPRDRG